MNKMTDNRRARALSSKPASVICAALGLLLSAVLQAQAPSLESPSVIREAARNYVQGLLKDSGTSTVSPGILDNRLRLAHCEVPLGAALPAGANMQARVTVRVSCAQPRWSIFVPLLVETRTAVLVLKHPVDRGALLGLDDVTLESRNLAGAGLAYLTAPADLNGRVVRRALPAGTTLTVDMFVAETIVHRGQEVTLLAGGGGIEVRAAGRATMDGAAGTRIQVLNLSSNRMVEGVVESAEVVRVGL